MFKIEINLSDPVNKVNSLTNLFVILNNLGINDEKDFAVNFVTEKQNNLVNKIITCFRKIEIAELFYSHINENSVQYKFSNLVKDYSETDEQISFDKPESITDSICIMNEDWTLYNNDTIDECKVANDLIKPSDQENAQDSDEPIEVYSNKPIDEDDIGPVIVFLENSRASGGGEISKFELDKEKKKLLTVWFAKNSTRDRVLSKKILKFDNYVLNVRKRGAKLEYELDTKMLILRNLKPNLALVEMLAENLVINDDEKNEIVKLTQSEVFTDKTTYYVRFKFDFDYEKVEKHLARIQTRFEKKIELIKAYKTHSIVIRMADPNEPLVLEMISLHFTNKKRSGVSFFENIVEKEQYIILTFDSDETIEFCLNMKHEISKKKLLVEYLYNSDLVEIQETALAARNELNKQGINNQPLIQEEKTQQTVISDEPVEEKFQYPTEVPSFVYDLQTQPNAFALKYWNESQLYRLTVDLLDLDAAMGKITNQNKISIECTSDFKILNLKSKNDYDKVVICWKKKILNKIKNFFAEFDSQKIIIKNPAKFLLDIKYDNLKINLKKLDKNESNSEYEVAGFKEQVSKLIDSIKKEDDSVDQKKQETDEITGLKLHECRILLVNEYIQNLTELFEGIKVDLSVKTGVIKIAGTRDEIEVAKLTAKELLNRIVSRLVNKKALFLNFIHKREATVVRWLKEKFPCVLEVDLAKNALIIYATNQSIIDKFLIEVSFKIKEREFDLSIVEDKIKLNQYLKRMELDKEIVLNDWTENGYLSFCGFDQKVDNVYHDLCELT